MVAFCGSVSGVEFGKTIVRTLFAMDALMSSFCLPEHGEDGIMHVDRRDLLRARKLEGNADVLCVIVIIMSILCVRRSAACL